VARYRFSEFVLSPRRRVLIRDGREQVLPGKVELQLRPGDRLRIETPGGGGWGATTKGP